MIISLNDRNEKLHVVLAFGQIEFTIVENSVIFRVDKWGKRTFRDGNVWIYIGCS